MSTAAARVRQQARVVLSLSLSPSLHPSLSLSLPLCVCLTRRVSRGIIASPLHTTAISSTAMYTTKPPHRRGSHRPPPQTDSLRRDEVFYERGEGSLASQSAFSAP